MTNSPNGRRKRLQVAGAASAALACLLLVAGAIAEDPKDIIAAQLRSQDYLCDHPQSAIRDSESSKPNEAVWVLVCEQATYRVILVPNMAARVEVLSENDRSSPTSR